MAALLLSRTTEQWDMEGQTRAALRIHSSATVTTAFHRAHLTQSRERKRARSSRECSVCSIGVYRHRVQTDAEHCTSHSDRNESKYSCAVTSSRFFKHRKHTEKDPYVTVAHRTLCFVHQTHTAFSRSRDAVAVLGWQAYEPGISVGYGGSVLCR